MVTIDIILASNSPRRKEILNKFIKDLRIISSNQDENFDINYDIITNQMSISKKKGEEISTKYKDSIIISADTIVYMNGEIFHKPKTREEAKRCLTLLSNEWHSVITSYCISSYNLSRIVCDYEITRVKFKDLSKSIIDSYIDTGECFDKAGAYGIQDKGSVLVDRIEGDYFTVMGLPISKIYDNLSKYFNINILRG